MRSKSVKRLFLTAIASAILTLPVHSSVQARTSTQLQFQGTTSLDIYVDEAGYVNCRPYIEGRYDDGTTANLAYEAFLTDPNGVNHGQSRVRYTEALLGWLQEPGASGNWSCTSDFYVDFDQTPLGVDAAHRVVTLNVP